MEWRNALKDDLPSHLQTVLISYNGIYYTTVFNADERKFYLREEEVTFIELKDQPIYWVEM